MKCRLAAAPVRSRLARAPAVALLGSVSPALMREVSESLAGHLARVELTPFLLPELGAKALMQLWLCGGFADGGVLRASRYPVWQRDYLSLMTQRDLPAWGLAARPQVTELLRHPACGASWEGFVIEQLLGALAAQGVDAEAHFLRTSEGYEIDLLLGIGGTLVAIEVKLAAGATPQALARLERAADMVSAEHRYIVCQTAAPAASATRSVLDLATTLARLKALAPAKAGRRAP